MVVVFSLPTDTPDYPTSDLDDNWECEEV